MFQQSKNRVYHIRFLLGKEEFSVSVPEGETILEVALDADIPIRFGCLYGDCTLCASRLLEGTVSQVQATGLTQEQKEEGLILLCVAIPLSDCRISIGLL